MLTSYDANAQVHGTVDSGKNMMVSVFMLELQEDYLVFSNQKFVLICLRKFNK